MASSSREAATHEALRGSSGNKACLKRLSALRFDHTWHSSSGRSASHCSAICHACIQTLHTSSQLPAGGRPPRLLGPLCLIPGSPRNARKLAQPLHAGLASLSTLHGFQGQPLLRANLRSHFMRDWPSSALSTDSTSTEWMGEWVPAGRGRQGETLVGAWSQDLTSSPQLLSSSHSSPKYPAAHKQPSTPPSTSRFRAPNAVLAALLGRRPPLAAARPAPAQAPHRTPAGLPRACCASRAAPARPPRCG